MTERDKTTVDDIIGIVHTDEPTDSVEEVRKLRGRENMTEKRVKLHIKWYNIEKTEGEATLTDNGQPLIQTERITDARLLKNILNDLYNENEQLRNKKERYKLLSEIRQQEINNRILTIKEFITNCSDNKVRSALKKLFYSEVKEYDLSVKYRKVIEENEQLKKELESFKPIIFESDGKPVTLYKKGDAK